MTGQPLRVTDYLVADHRRLDELFARATAGERLDAAPFAAFRAGLLRHIAIEEKLLLPAARQARGGVPLERAFHLRVEHAALTSLLVPTPDLALCGQIRSVLVPHEATEEGATGVFAECEQLFSAAQSAALAGRAAAFPQVRVAPHADGPRAHRTAASALAAAARMRRPDTRQRGDE